MSLRTPKASGCQCGVKTESHRQRSGLVWFVAVLMFGTGAFLLAWFNGTWAGAVPGIPLVFASCILITRETWIAMGDPEFWDA